MAVKRIPQPADQTFHFKNGKNNVTARLRFSGSFSQDQTEKLQKAQAALDSETMRVLEPYMPDATHNMIDSMTDSTHPGDGEIHVNTPYAAKVNYVSGVMGRNGTLRGRLFFDRMKADKLAYLKWFITKMTGIKVK